MITMGVFGVGFLPTAASLVLPHGVGESLTGWLMLAAPMAWLSVG
jgi:hypothetical protein